MQVQLHPLVRFDIWVLPLPVGASSWRAIACGNGNFIFFDEPVFLDDLVLNIGRHAITVDILLVGSKELGEMEEEEIKQENEVT